jgi:hypothetical protein
MGVAASIVIFLVILSTSPRRLKLWEATSGRLSSKDLRLQDERTDTQRLEGSRFNACRKT